MPLRTHSAVALGVLALGACRSGPEPSGSPRASAGPADTALASASVRADGSAVPSAVVSAEPKAALPALKPILKKPFPEGADEATVCEAIDSKEPNLWVRFGHIVPAYITGALYILETGPENKDKLYDFILNKYVHGYDSQQASCRGSVTLLYIRTMFDKSEYLGKPFGREHLSQEIEKKLGIKTRQSFQFQYDVGRQAEYCRADAELCDALEKLDVANEGTGLCGGALPFVGVSETDDDYAQQLEACRSLPLATLVCAYFGFSLRSGKESTQAREACRETIKKALREKMETTRWP